MASTSPKHSGRLLGPSPLIDQILPVAVAQVQPHVSKGEWAPNTLDRSLTAASRVPSAASPYLCSIVARMEVVSYWVWSTTKSPRRRGAMINVGIRVPGPHSSCGPLLLPCPGGATWSHDPPNSSYVTTTMVSLRQALLLIADTRSTRWLLPRVSLV